ncbi:hypothetical protein [Cytobacillus horneckiae]|uniref:hypothetical protein n=1 Tax=Cytobacillus horneckiae TaxID=549687 RepID=UPI003D9A7C63
MGNNTEIWRIGNDNYIEIKDIQQEKMAEIDPKHLKLLNEEKVYGGIFNDKSIKLNRINNNDLIFTPDSTNLKYNFKRSNDNNNSGGGDDGMGDLERRVENLEHSTRKIQEQLEAIKEDTLTTRTKMESVVTKADLLQIQTTLTQTLQDCIKPLPKENDIKVLINEAIQSNQIPNQTKVENMINKSQKSLVKYIVGTGITTIGAIVAIIKLFL